MLVEFNSIGVLFMHTTTRLLLPFTGNINALALDYAVQLAEQRQATLVPLALIAAQSGKGARLEHIQQAQDFLELTRRKAERQGVPIEPMRLYTQDAACSIEAIASEMECEAILLFLYGAGEVLLEHAEIRSLMDNSACNMHILLLPEKRGRRMTAHPLHIPFRRRPGDEEQGVALPQERAEKAGSFVQRIIRSGGRG